MNILGNCSDLPVHSKNENKVNSELIFIVSSMLLSHLCPLFYSTLLNWITPSVNFHVLLLDLCFSYYFKGSFLEL